MSEGPATAVPEAVQVSPTPVETAPTSGSSGAAPTQSKITPEEYIPYQPGDVEKTSSPVVQQLWKLAVRYWNAEPSCPTGYHVLVNNITDQPQNPDGTGQEAAGEAGVPGCYMRIIPSYWLEELTPDQQTENTCAVFIHEFGHSLGHPHTTDPNSVMNPFTMYSTGMPSECKELATPVIVMIHVSKARKHKKHRRVRKLHIKRTGKPDATGAAPFVLALDPFIPSLLS